jgi:hypothetical protein
MEGDVILLDSHTKVNKFGQKFLANNFSASPPTHVAFVSSKYLVYHAMPKPSHVEVTVVHEILNPGKAWRVWRNIELFRELVSDSSKFAQLSSVADSYLGDSYRFQNFFKARQNSSYCSELVGKIFNELGYPFPDEPSTLLPLHVQEYVLKNENWCDVTHEYASLLNDDMLYRILYAKNIEIRSLSSQAFLRAKQEMNNFFRGFAAATSGVKPESRVSVDRGKHGWVAITPIGPEIPVSDLRVKKLVERYSYLYSPVPTGQYDGMSLGPMRS